MAVRCAAGVRGALAYGVFADSFARADKNNVTDLPSLPRYLYLIVLSLQVSEALHMQGLMTLRPGRESGHCLGYRRGIPSWRCSDAQTHHAVVDGARERSDVRPGGDCGVRSRLCRYPRP